VLLSVSDTITLLAVYHQCSNNDAVRIFLHVKCLCVIDTTQAHCFL